MQTFGAFIIEQGFRAHLSEAIFNDHQKDDPCLILVIGQIGLP